MVQSLADVPDAAVVIVNWQIYDALADCLDALPAALRRGDGTDLSSQTVVVDNDSDPARLRALCARYPWLSVIANAGNRGFAAACNQGIAATRSRYLLLLNPDTVPAPGSIARLVADLDAHAGAAVCGPRLDNASGGLERSCRRFPRLRYLLSDVLLLSRIRALWPLCARYYYGEWDYRSHRAVDQVSGACFLMRRVVIDQIGALDERFFVYFEEVDWCRRARAAGHEVHYQPEARVLHLGGAASAQAGPARVAYTHASARAYWAKHHTLAGRAGLEAVLGLDRLGRWIKSLRTSPRSENPCVDSRAS